MFSRIVALEPASGVVDVQVHGTERLVRVELWCGAAADLSQRLGGEDGADPLAALVDRVEVGSDGGRGYCRLTQQIRPAR